MKAKHFLIALSLLPIFFAGAFVGQAAGFDPVHAGTAFVGLALVKVTIQHIVPGVKMVSGLLATAIDITELATKLGAYHREHRDILFTEMLQDDDFTQDLEVMSDVTDELPLPNLSLIDLTKPANATTFSPTTNSLKFGARILKVRGIKVDLQLIPQVLEKTWLGKMKKANDPWDIPFEQFIMKYINSKITEEIRLKSLYKGVYNAAGTTPTDNFNGYLKLIADEITATNITPIVTGAITAVNVIDKVEQTYDGLGEVYKGKPSIMKCSPTIFDWYVRRYRLDYGKNMDYSGMKRDKVLLDGTQCELVREPGMASSQRLITSPKENFVYGVDSASGYTMDVQKFERTLKILIDFKAGVEFAQIHSRALAVNDQA